jgi:photosystem II stability/assembly factor-like uncharacterized protein
LEVFMRQLFRLLVAALFLHSGLLHALTVDEIVARHVQARGGMERIRAIKSLRLTGKVLFGGGDFSIEAAWARAAVRPGRLREEITLQGLTAVDAWDGKDAWSVQPFGGRRDPERISADEARARAQDADFEGPLVGWREKGHAVESLGAEDVDGTPALKLRVTLKDGDVVTIFLDPDLFLTIREARKRMVRGTEQLQESDFGSYGPVAGVLFPLSIESGPPNRPRMAKLTIEQAEADVEIDPALFGFPAAGTAVTRAILAGPKPAAAETKAASRPVAAGAAPFDAGVLSGLGARNIGSATMSGRISALAARNEGGKTTYFVGAASGGVWRSLDGGTIFRPVFDRMPVQSIGAIAIDPTNPKTVWVGTGESWVRNSVSVGDGIYRSTDGGETWTNMGLPESERIVQILVHPKDGNVVYACVPGKLWSDSPDRGLYRTADGGKSWSLVLSGPNLSTGCGSVTMDPKDPEVLFASLWDYRRKGWTFRSGGDGPKAPSGSGLFRTADGGKSWTPLTASTNKGLPAGPWGRVEAVIAPSDPKIVYALVEGTDSALFRSADGGATWEKRDKSQGMVWRPFYFARLIVDPKNPDKLWKPGGGLIVSEDGGRSFAYSGGRAHGDWHDVWVDPDNAQHVAGGDDGGFWVSWDGGTRWWKTGNLPVSQFYHVSVDAKDPYQVYGGLQDNSSWVGDSAYPGGISNSRWENLYGGDGFWVVVDPSDPNIVYAESQGGYVARIDRRTGASRDIQPKALYKEKLRFNWNTPIAASPTDGKSVYLGAQVLFRTRDKGDTWERISPDLTTNDPEKQKQEESGGVTVDNSSAEMYTTIYSISESPKDPNVVWVGTDDGNVQLTRDGGKSWTNVAPNVPGLPKGSWVSWVEASRFDAGTAYATIDRHTFGDMTPWAFRTADYGKSWTRIVGPGSGVRGYAHVIREDTVRPSLLFLGTEMGLFVSVDGGARWAEFTGGSFPKVAVRDLVVHPRENDLVIGTHGRGIWIVDDLTPLRALTPEVLAKEAAFLSGRPVQQRMGAQGGWVEGDAAFVGENPPGGAVITYYQRTRHLLGPISLEILDSAGQVVATLNPPKRRGVNRVTWSMQVPPPRVPRAATLAFGASQGPRVLPGVYTVRLTKGSEVIEGTLPIGLDRRAPYTAADRKEQFDAAMRVHALFSDMSALVDRIEAARAAAGAKAKGLSDSDPLKGKVAARSEALENIRRKIVATKEGGAITGEERIREHADILYSALLGWEGKPARYQIDRIDALKRELDDVAKELADLTAKEIAP